MHEPGETVSLTLLRRAKPVTVEVELGRRNVSQGNMTNPKSDLNAVMRTYAPQSLPGWATASQPSVVTPYHQ
ncbi:MAG TPA: hypothetical protein VGI81_18630, partial [Tepidisphaeraceae bacterium]